MTARHDDVWQALLAARERALRVARARCSDPHEADDCVQEAMARIAAMPHVDVDRIDSLVSTVVANLAVDAHRARSRTFKLETRLQSVGGVESSPDEAVCERDEARWLWSLRGSLGEQDRRALELRVAGRTVSETAHELGVTYKAAENALGRARKRLKTAWAATAALIGVLWGRRPAQPSAALVAVPVAVLATATLGVLSPAQTTDSAQPLAPRLDFATTAVPAAPPAAAAGPPDAPAPPAPRGPEPAHAPITAPKPQHEQPTPEQIAATEPVEVMEYRVADPVTVEYHKGGGLVEDIQRCVEEGPRLEGDVLGCPPP